MKIGLGFFLLFAAVCFAEGRSRLEIRKLDDGRNIFIEVLPDGTENMGLKVTPEGNFEGFLDPELKHEIYRRYLAWPEAPPQVVLFRKNYEAEKAKQAEIEYPAAEGGSSTEGAHSDPSQQPVTTRPVATRRNLVNTNKLLNQNRYVRPNLCPESFIEDPDTCEGMCHVTVECESYGGVTVARDYETPKEELRSALKKHKRPFGVPQHKNEISIIAHGVKNNLNLNELLPLSGPNEPHTVRDDDVHYYGDIDPETNTFKPKLLSIKMSYTTKINDKPAYPDLYLANVYVKIGKSPDEVCIVGIRKLVPNVSDMLAAGYSARSLESERGGAGIKEYGHVQLRETRKADKDIKNFMENPPLCKTIKREDLREQARRSPDFSPPSGRG